MRQVEWLPGWTAYELPLSEAEAMSATHRKEREAMIGIGRDLFGLGVLPVFKNITSGRVPPSHLDGTGGNFAARLSQLSFLVTGAGTRKDRLTLDDFAIVERVLWGQRRIEFTSFGERKPSTDSLITAVAFETCPDISACIHAHCPVDTAHSIFLPYPTTRQADLDALRAMVAEGARVINLIDHDLAKTAPIGEEDAVIILGKNFADARDLATRFLTGELAKRFVSLPH